MKRSFSASAVLDINRRYYEKHSTEFAETVASIDLGDLYKMFLGRLRPKARILDAGCGTGRDSAVFMRLGYRVSAFDASPAMVRTAAKLGVAARVATFRDFDYPVQFDGIWACASLLHVPHSEVRSALRRLKSALIPGGVLFVTLKEGQGQRLAEDGRFFAYYRQRTVVARLREVGGWSAIYSRRAVDGRSRPWLQFLAVKRAVGEPVRRATHAELNSLENVDRA